jgi:hypothetical protein
VSGPVTTEDTAPAGGAPVATAAAPSVELVEGRRTSVGGVPVTRLLPKRTRRTVGAWCFIDHMGPVDATAADPQIGPHPHIGLQTVTWILEGELLHRDSIGSEQLIRPGQLNLMSAGRGVVHAEESPGGRTGRVHGVQLWVAQPEATRHGAPAFQHLSSLTDVDLGDGVVATVLVGELHGAASPARADTPLVGADVVVAGSAALPLDVAFEHAVVVVEGSVTVDGASVGPGVLASIGPGRDELHVAGGGRILLLGGVPLEERLVMWWNFVARSPEEVDAARLDWVAGAERFGDVHSRLGRIEAPERRRGG